MASSSSGSPPGSAISGSELADGPGPTDEQLVKAEADSKEAALKAAQDKPTSAQDPSAADSAKSGLGEKTGSGSSPTDEELEKAEELKKYLAELNSAQNKAAQNNSAQNKAADKAAQEKATDKAAQNKAAQNRAAQDKAGSSSKTPGAGLNLASSASDLIPGTWKWRQRDGHKAGSGKWLALFGFNNTWRYDQKVTVVGVRREVRDGRRSSSSFQQVGVVPAGSLTHIKVESDLCVTLNKSGGISKEKGVVSVELTDVKVETTDENGRATTYHFSINDKPARAKYPSNLGS